jgi:hypothetical protein
VEFNTVIAMCEALGFGPKFLSWISNILHSTPTSVLLNGVPGKNAKEGLDRVTPISPFLFLSTAELLQYIINEAWHNGYLELPFENNFGQKYPIIQYADDTLLIMLADLNQLLNLKGLLQFSEATGLRVNYNKTTMVPINVQANILDNLTTTFGCKAEALPFTCLGFPLV